MKKLILSLILVLGALSAQAMSYERAREEARFLTDKMAYELNLDDQQYNDCYEINLDYLLSISTESDLVYGNYLSYRNADLRHILYDWQWSIFAAADYFLNPVSWFRGAWYFPIYRHYRVGYFYYDHPRVFWSYRGGHGRHYFHTGFYAARRPQHWRGGFRGMDRGPVGHHPSAGRTGRPGYTIGNPNHHDAGRTRGSIEGGRSHSGYSIGSTSHSQSTVTPNHSTNTPGRNGGRSSYQRESSTRTTVHSSMSQGRPSGTVSRPSGSVSRSGSMSQGRPSGSIGHSSSRGSSMGHSAGASSRGGSPRGGGRGGR